MPLLKRQPFERQKPPKDLHPNEELFYCKLTNEVFRDYEAFFERVILCNSLVWTCRFTGRVGLTYAEAAASEERARISLLDLPDAIKRTVIFLASRTRHGRLADLCDDIYNFARDRYFIGEQLDAVVHGERKTCRIEGVHAISKQQMNGFLNGRHSSSDDDPRSSHEGSGNTRKCPASSTYRYQVRELGNGNAGTCTVSSDDVLRRKGVYTRERNKLLIRRICELKDGIWAVKEKYMQMYCVQDMTFRDIFSGALPSFVVIPSRKRSSSSSGKADPTKKGEKLKKDGKHTRKQEAEAKKLKAKAEEDRLWKKVEQERHLKQEMRLKLEDMKRLKREEKEKEREQKREERRLLADFLKDWQKPRDDLDCDDLLDLPAPIPINCSIPNEQFGNVVMVLEFVHNFGDLLTLKDYFPGGLTFELLERALSEKDIQGPLADLLLMLLKAIFTFQNEEEEVQGVLEDAAGAMDLDNDHDETDLSTDRAIQAATASATWPLYYHGTAIREMTLDAYTLTEILRLHLLSSGARTIAMNGRWNHQQRGGYTCYDDPGLQLRLHEPNVVHSLATSNVYDISLRDKLQILMTLVDQLLSYVYVRDLVEERLEKLRLMKCDLKQLQWAEQRRVKERISLRWKKRMEGKLPDQQLANDVPEKNAEKTNSDESGNEGNIQEEELEHKNEAELNDEDEAAESQRKLDFQRKEKELVEAMTKLQHGGSITPLGRDRAYRRFWMFLSLPGLFVEDDDTFVGRCLAHPTPQNPYSNPYIAFNLSRGVQKNNVHNGIDGKSTASDKENESVPPLKGGSGSSSVDLTALVKNHKLLSDLPPAVNGTILPSGLEDAKLYPDGVKGSSTAGPRKSLVFGLCNAQSSACPVHDCSLPRTKWAFFSRTEQVEALIAALNPRGHREGSLKEVLVADKKRILQSVNRCPESKLNVAVNGDSEQELRKSLRLQQASCPCPPGTFMESVLESTLKDMILEVEERVYAGGLGCVKVGNRTTWRQAVGDGTFSEVTENGPENEKRSEDVVIPTQESTITVEDNKDVPNGLKIRSGACTPSSSTVIKNLVTILLQLADGIEHKYLKSPLGGDEDVKKPRSKHIDSTIQKHAKDAPEGQDDSPANLNAEVESPKTSSELPPRAKNALERWKESLMSSTNLSQLILHLSTLERSVAWSRSALNARCRICRRRGDGEKMLLCDGCDRGHHMFCLKPPLNEVPEGDWFCSDCKPPEPRRSERKSHKPVDPDYLSEHEIDALQSHINEDVCCICKKAGHLICCDGCPLSFHLGCVDPPLRRVPRGRWECLKCAGKTLQRVKAQQQLESQLSEDEHRTHAMVTRHSVKSVVKSTTESVEVRRLRPSTKENRKYYCEDKDGDFLILGRRHSTPVRRGASNDAPLNYKVCDQLLTELGKQDDGWPFMRPVTKKEAPSYHEVIKRPLNFGAIRSKLNAMVYKNNKEFVADCLLLFQNCRFYNQAHTEEHQAGERLCRYFSQRCTELQLDNCLHYSPSTSGSEAESTTGESDSTEDVTYERSPSKRRRLEV